MKGFSKKYFLLFLLGTSLFFHQNSFANIGMPGFWNVGAGVNFQFFFAKDSIYKDLIQMQEELITIQLYKGFAVVKGKYRMRNKSKDKISITMGYPVNSVFANPAAQNVVFDDIHKLKILAGNKEIQYRKLKGDSTSVAYYAPSTSRSNEWYVWEDTFPANSVREITVFFIVNTNNASIKDGYNTGKGNGFSYLLESGRAWAGNIDKGRIYIELKDGLKTTDIQGIFPDSTFRGDETRLVYDFKDLEPDQYSNVVLRYGEKIENFNFEEVLKKSEDYYKDIDGLDAGQTSTKNFSIVSAGNFEVDNQYGSVLISIVYFVFALVSIGMPLLILVLGISMFVVWVRKRGKK